MKQFYCIKRFALLWLAVGFMATLLTAESIDPKLIISDSTSINGAKDEMPLRVLRNKQAPSGNSYTTPITFSEFGMGTVITDQYAYLGIIFGPNSAFISGDGSSSKAPVLSGVPQFQGAISGSFVDPDNITKKIGASAIKMRVGYMNEIRTVRLYLYDKKGSQIDAQTTTVKDEFEYFNIKAADKLFYSWKIQTIANEPAGYAIDDFSVQLEKPKNINATIKITSDYADSSGSTPEPVTGKDITATVELRDEGGSIVNYTFTECKWGNIPDLSTKTLVEKEGDRTDNCKITFQYAKEEGPKDIAYGGKTLEFAGTVQMDFGEEQEVFAKHEFKVFFDKDNVDSRKNNYAPNWFYYWGINNAVQGLSDTNIQYKQSISGYGETYLGTGEIIISGIAAGEHYPGGIAVPSKTNCPGGNFGGAKGIDSVTEILVHEKTHLWTYNNWKNGVWLIGITSDSDDPTPNFKARDASGRYIDDDWLPDFYETSVVGTSPTNRDSCGMVSKSPGYATYGDNEYYAMAQGHNQKGIVANDWANPGAQTQPVFKAAKLFAAKADAPQYPQYYSEFFEDYRYIPSGNYFAFGNYTYIGGVSDNLVDENGDGVADYLSIKVKFYLSYSGQYGLTGYLTDNTGKLFATATTKDILDVGENIIELRFDTKLLSTYGKSGVFHLKGLKLDMTDNWGDGVHVGGILDAYTTKSYSLDGLPLQAVRFTGENFSDEGIDTNGNGLYETIDVSVELEVNKAGEYIIVAQHAGCVSGETKKYLQTGKQKVIVSLDLRDAIKMRCRDTLVLNAVSAYHSNGDFITLLNTNYTLKTQDFDKYEKPVVFVNELSFEDYLVDLDEHKGADFIALDVDVLVNVAGEYEFSYKITDKDDNIITTREHYLTFDEKGERRLYLSVPTDPFYQKQIDGPYYVKLFRVFNSNGIIVDSLESFRYETKPYKWKEFQPFESNQKPSLFQGSLITTGADIDENGDVFVWGFRGSAQQGNGKLSIPSR
ncbi:MAG: hypothetical protein LBP54_05395, partial [Campylobacteraceae bacterium]|nr:hypothetical protein [Campylobacteraceae bacterium]